MDAVSAQGVIPYRNVVEDIGSLSFIVPKHMTREGGPVAYLGGFNVSTLDETSISYLLDSGELGPIVNQMMSESKQGLSSVPKGHSAASSRRLLEAGEKASEAVAAGTKSSRALRAAAAAASITRRRL